MIRFSLLIFLGLSYFSAFSQSDFNHPTIYQFQCSRCSEINSWSESLDSSNITYIPNLHSVYDSSCLIPYSIFYLDDLTAEPENGFLNADTLFLQLPNESKVAAIFQDAQKPSMILIQTQDSIARFTFYQSCVLHY